MKTEEAREPSVHLQQSGDPWAVPSSVVPSLRLGKCQGRSPGLSLTLAMPLVLGGVRGPGTHSPLPPLRAAAAVPAPPSALALGQLPQAGELALCASQQPWAGARSSCLEQSRSQQHPGTATNLALAGRGQPCAHWDAEPCEDEQGGKHPALARLWMALNLLLPGDS